MRGRSRFFPDNKNEGKSSMRKRTLIGFFAFGTIALLAGCANSLEPPVIVGGLKFPKSPPPDNTSQGISVWLLPVTDTGNGKRLGTLFHALGSRSHLLVRESLSQSIQKKIEQDLVDEGFSVQMAKTSNHPLTVSVSIEKIEDRVSAAPLNVRQKAVVILSYKIITRSSDGTTRSMSGTITRHQSPTPDALFHRSTPPSLIGSMVDDEIRHELIPMILRTGKESS
jgi:uncharacterized lipoprotein YajG